MQRLIRDLIAATSMVAISYVGATFAHAEDTLSKIRDTQTITLAYRESSMPFSYLDDNKKPIGFALDLCLEIADAVKRELKLSKLNIAYVPVTSSNRIQAIVDGKADLECGSSTNDAERRKKVAFTIPHFIAASKMLVRADSGIKNWTDLHDKKIVMTKGTTPVKLLLDRDKVRDLHLTVVEGRDHGDSFAMIEKGQVNAFAMHDAMLYGLRANAANPDSFNIVGDPLSSEPYAIMLRKDDAPFKRIVDREMARIINDGEFSKLYDKWFTRPIPPKGLNLHMPMGYLLRDSLRFPSDKVADQ